MAISLSCLSISKYYEVELVTDSFGKSLLVDELNLPYTTVITVLDELETYDNGLWALGKLKAYSVQDRPFIHIDNDIFIWNSFPSKITSGKLIAQNLEGTKNEYYNQICRSLVDNSFQIPNYLNDYIENNENERVCAYNAGILGGSEISFFKEYTETAFNIINNNIERLHLIDVGLFNIFFEQSLFYVLSKKRNIQIETLITESDLPYIPFDFDSIPNKWFIHTLGNTKKHEIVNEQVYLRLLKEHPKFYYQVKETVKNFVFQNDFF